MMQNTDDQQISVFNDDNPAPEPPPVLGEEMVRKRSVEKAEKRKKASITITGEQLESLVEALNKLPNKTEESREERRNRHLYDTRCLLRNYRIFKLYRGSQAEDACAQTAGELLEIMGCPTPESRYSQNMARIIQETCWLLDYVDRALLSYKLWCESYGSYEQQRRLRVAMAKWIDDEAKTFDEICEKENISDSTLRRDLDMFVDDFGPMVFGIETIDYQYKHKKRTKNAESESEEETA